MRKVGHLLSLMEGDKRRGAGYPAGIRGSSLGALPPEDLQISSFPRFVQGEYRVSTFGHLRGGDGTRPLKVGKISSWHLVSSQKSEHRWVAKVFTLLYFAIPVNGRAL